MPANAGHTRVHGFDPWVSKITWSRKWQPTPVSLPGKPHEQRSLVGYSPWGRKESDTTEQLSIRTHRLIKGLIYLSLPLLLFLSSISFLLTHKHSRKPKRKPLKLFGPPLQACFLISITPSQNAFP